MLSVTYVHRGVHTPHFLLHLQAVFWTVFLGASCQTGQLGPSAPGKAEVKRQGSHTQRRGGNGALPPESCAAQAVPSHLDCPVECGQRLSQPWPPSGAGPVLALWFRGSRVPVGPRGSQESFLWQGLCEVLFV